VTDGQTDRQECYSNIVLCIAVQFLECFDTVGWMTGRTACYKPVHIIPQRLSVGANPAWCNSRKEASETKTVFIPTCSQAGRFMNWSLLANYTLPPIVVSNQTHHYSLQISLLFSGRPLPSLYCTLQRMSLMLKCLLRFSIILRL